MATYTYVFTTSYIASYIPVTIYFCFFAVVATNLQFLTAMLLFTDHS